MTEISDDLRKEIEAAVDDVIFNPGCNGPDCCHVGDTIGLIEQFILKDRAARPDPLADLVEMAKKDAKKNHKKIYGWMCCGGDLDWVCSTIYNDVYGTPAEAIAAAKKEMEDRR